MFQSHGQTLSENHQKKTSPSRVNLCKKGPLMLVQFRDPTLSLWQSAMDATIHQAAAQWVPRPDLSGSSREAGILREVANHCASVAEKIPFGELLLQQPAFARFLHLPPPATVHESISYCSTLWKHIAQARLRGDAAEVAKWEAEIDFGSCDPRYAEAVEKYIEYFQLRRQPIPYVSPQGADFAVESIPDDCKIALMGDWGTGQEAARLCWNESKLATPTSSYISAISTTLEPTMRPKIIS
jgi:hypothetical protein